MPDDFDFNPRRKFFRSPLVEEEYNKRVYTYLVAIKEEYPDLWQDDLHMTQVKEFVRCEIELELLDRQIGNDGFESSAWLEKMRKSVRDALFRHRSDLMITLKMMAKMTKDVESDVDVFEKVFAGLPNAEFEP